MLADPLHMGLPYGDIADDLAFKVAAKLSSRKAHDFLGAKAQRAVAKSLS